MPDQQRSSSCFPVCSLDFPRALFSSVCSSHGGDSLAQDGQVHARRVVGSELVSHFTTNASRRVVEPEFDSQLSTSIRRGPAEPCDGARFRARAASATCQRPLVAAGPKRSDWTSAPVSYISIGLGRRSCINHLGTTRTSLTTEFPVPTA